ncbi:hypothetical protein BaRGS_00000379 [Batillaria attramentaria]|uniref:Solute-binding protein family 3/N-terminal domain-containing protein n=1 Tax=Batillaria attramentaria TaxID=370345 RepID=A0ABD0M9L5_9CAEN
MMMMGVWLVTCLVLVLGIPLVTGHAISINILPGSQTKHLEESQPVPQFAAPGDDKVWLFAISGRRKPFQFVNDIGEIEGFNVDLIKGVCAVAGKKCSMVLAEFTECIYTSRDITYPGRGLMAGWFDACPGYAIAVDRQDTFDFTLPFVSNSAYFAVAPGNPSGFDPSAEDFSAFTITHLTGAYTNAACLRRLQKTVGKIIIAANLPEAKQLLLNGTAQVLFAPRSSIPDLEVLPDRISCTDGGAGMMVKKGSPLPSWWNPAFRRYYSSGRFHRLCQEDGVKYNSIQPRIPWQSTPYHSRYPGRGPTAGATEPRASQLCNRHTGVSHDPSQCSRSSQCAVESVSVHGIKATAESNLAGFAVSAE